ncbi:protein YnaN [Escherichia coli]|nr:protein YnaN [Escherichia coli]
MLRNRARRLDYKIML